MSTTMKSGEVDVGKIVKIQVAGGLDNHSHVTGAMHVVYKSFDSESMTVPWIVAEPGNFTDSKGNVRASVGGEREQHHANNRPVAPL